MNSYRTELKQPSFPFDINYASTMFSIGSCFSWNIAKKIQNANLNINLSPFGISYNPISIVNSIERLFKKTEYKNDDLAFHNDLWHSFDHHGDYSNQDKEKCLKNINNDFITCSEKLNNNSKKTVFITFGSAMTYYHKESNKIVSNCHKLPAMDFEKKEIDKNEVMKRFSEIIIKAGDDFNFVFAVSPIRYLEYGLPTNNYHKAILLCVVHELCATHQNAHYFPSYEILIDDLRDYRFYAEDKIHPSETAINHIWEVFKKSFFSQQTMEKIIKIEKLKKTLAHKPINPNSEKHKELVEKTIEELGNLLKPL